MSRPAREIRAVLEESGPDFEDFAFERPSAGHQGEVFFVTLVHEGREIEVVVKFQTDGDDGAFALEPFLHEYVADRTEVPIPRILVFQEDPDVGVPPYFVTERIEGENLATSLSDLDGDLRLRIVEQAGRILGDMHSRVGFEGFGRLALDESGDRLVVEDCSWEWLDVFRTVVEAYVDQLGEGTFADLQSIARSHIEEALGVVESDGVPRLVHGDFRPANMLVDESAAEPITAVLDWQFALAADPEYHLARTDFLFIGPAFEDSSTRDRLRARLHDGYRECREFEADEGYERRRDVYHFATLLWRMATFDAAFDDAADLARARAEARFRQQFENLAAGLPE